MKLGEWLRAEHQKRGLTWAELEALTGMSTNALRNIENNPNARPGWDTVVKIADGLGVPRDVLFEMAGKPTHTDEPLNLTPAQLGRAMNRAIDSLNEPARTPARKMWEALASLLRIPADDGGRS